MAATTDTTDAPSPGEATRTVHGTCMHDCPDSCGWQVTVHGDGPAATAVQLRGNPDHPYNQGDLCPKVTKFLDRVDSPERVLHPLRRVGAKGDGHFEQITWDEALTTIAQRWQQIVDTDGAEAIMPYSDAGNQSLLAMSYPERFWNRLGATRVVRAICGPTVGEGVKATNGTALGLDPLELRHSKLILLWGTNTRLTNRHLWPTIEAARADGAQLVVIDPIRTITADSADWFVPIRPGTDVALMLGIIHVLIRDGLVDQPWVDAHTVGFAELRDHVSEWTPQRSGNECGIPAADIERLASLYGTVKPAAIRTLVGAEHHSQGAMIFRTMACLPALTGQWQHRGGGLARSIGSWTSRHFDSGALEAPHLLGDRQPRWVNMSRLGETLTTAVDPPIRSIMVWNCNPMVITPNTELIRQGLLRDDLFTVVHEQFITDTARYADIVLPATTQIEAVDVVPSWGHLWLGWNEAAIPPRGEAVSNSELHRRLAAALGFTEPELYEDDMSALRNGMPTVDVDRLRAEGWVKMPYPDDGRPFGDGVFPTASGKVELHSTSLVALGQPALPTYVPSSEGHRSPLAGRYPLQLLTNKQHQRFLNGSYAHLPRHAGPEGGPWVEMCATDVQARGLHDGQCVEVFNDRGRLQLPVKVTDRVRAGVVAVPWGWGSAGHPDGKVANSLTNDTLTDWGGGVAFYDTLVEVTAVREHR
jgi:anaerobic selenocysteine-containing dehydrogenase